MYLSHKNVPVALILGAAFLLADSQIPVGFAQSVTKREELTPPWKLAQQQPGEMYWAPLMRLRKAESQYRGTQLWGGYAQMRAQLEAGIGNHAAALEAWDSALAPRDSIGVLPPGIEARVAGEPLEAIPLDRCEAREGSRAWLFLPPHDDVIIRRPGADGSVLRSTSRP